MLDVTYILFKFFIDSLSILFSYVHNLEEIWTVSLSSTKDQLKNNYIIQIHGSFTSLIIKMAWNLMIPMRTLQ